MNVTSRAIEEWYGYFVMSHIKTSLICSTLLAADLFLEVTTVKRFKCGVRNLLDQGVGIICHSPIKMVYNIYSQENQRIGPPVLNKILDFQDFLRPREVSKLLSCWAVPGSLF